MYYVRQCTRIRTYVRTCVVLLNCRWVFALSCFDGGCEISSIIGWADVFEPRSFDYFELVRSDAILQNVLQCFDDDGIVLIQGVPKDNNTVALGALAKHLMPAGAELSCDEGKHGEGATPRACLRDSSAVQTQTLVSPVPAHTHGAFRDTPFRAVLLGIVSFEGPQTDLPVNVFVDTWRVMAHLDWQEVESLADAERTVSKKVVSCYAPWRRTGSGSRGGCQLRTVWNQGSGKTPVPSHAATLGRALKRFDSMVYGEDKGKRLQMQLGPGTAVLVDNWRVLHGREALWGGWYRRVATVDLTEDSLHARWVELSSYRQHSADL